MVMKEGNLIAEEIIALSSYSYKLPRVILLVGKIGVAIIARNN